MAYTCSEALAKIRGWYGWADYYEELSVTNNQTAWTHWNNFEDREALEHIIYASNQQSAAISMLIMNFEDFWPDFAIAWYLDNCAGADMDSILNAMLSASQEEFTKFIGIVDAYRVALWDAPFNEEFYAALARGFKTWGIQG